MTTYLIFLSSVVLFALSMCFTPGPNNALCMSIGLDKGFRFAVPYAVGAASGANVTLVLLFFGLGGVFDRYPAVYDALRYGGAVYMLWLAYKISGLKLFRKKTAEEAVSQKSRAAAPGTKDDRTPGLIQGLLFQLVNVKVWITNVIVVSNYIGAGEGMVARLLIVAGVTTVFGFSSMCLWAGGGAFMRRFLSSDGMRRANYLFALFLVFSVILLFV